MSKVYFSVTIKTQGKSKILELSYHQAKDIYRKIKASYPDASIGVFGAKDLETFRRTQRSLAAYPVTKSITEFLEQKN
jgi:hypothetical protein